MLLQGLALAQASGDQPVADENTFYRAFYLSRGERRYDEALELYRKFLAAAPDHKLVGKAASEAVLILQRSGRADEAQALREKYASALGAEADAFGRDALDPNPPRADAGGRGDRRRGDGAPGFGGGDRPGDGAGPAARRPLSDEDKQALQERLDELASQLAQAEQAGNDRDVQRLRRQMNRLQRQLAGDADAGQDRGPGAGGRGGPGGRGFRGAVFAEMDDAQTAAWVERFDSFLPNMVDRRRERGDDDGADRLEKQWTELKGLLEAGKKDEAQKAYDAMMEAMPRRRR